MQPISVTRHVAAPPEVVWRVATDVNAWERTLSGVDRVEVVAGADPFGEGTRWRETRTIGGRQATEEMWVSAVDPGHSYTVEADSRGTHYVSTFSFVPAAGGTDMTLSFGGEPRGAARRALASLLSKLMAGSVAKQLRRDLDDVASEAERQVA